MKLFGPHIHKPGMGLDLLERGQFAAALAMDVDSNYIREARQRSPETILVVRVYEDGAQFLEWTPEAWVGRLLAKFPEEKPDYFVTINEPFGHDSTELFERFDIWESGVIRLLQVAGTDGLACNFGTGNFTAGANRVRMPDVFPRICAIANAMGPHDYSWPTLEAGWSWYAGRWFQWYDDIKQATGREMKFLIGECGLTQAVIEGRPDHGWQSESPENVTAESYLAALRWYLTQVVNWDAGRGIVLGLCIFNWYDQFHWSFEHIDKPEVVDAIIAMDVPIPPPEPPNGGDDMRIPEGVKIYDFEHGPHADDPTVSKEWLESIFGESIDVHPVIEIHPDAQPGDIVYQLEWINCKAGSVSVIIEVKDVNGDPVIGETVIFGWPNADPHGLNDEGWNWTDNGAVGKTEAPDGHVGPALSTGSYYSPDQGETGPHFLWIWDHPSEMVDGVGMLASHHLVPGANHLHTEFGYRAVRWGEEPDEPVDEDILVAFFKLCNDVSAIREKYVGGDEDPEPPESDTDFFGDYFNNVSLDGEPVFTRTDDVINFDWGSGSPDPSVTPNYFSARWVAKKTFEEATYQFSAYVDDGIRIWVDDVLVLDKWVDQPPTTYYVDVAMTAGQHTIRIEYYERAGGATCQVAWHKVT